MSCSAGPPGLLAPARPSPASPRRTGSRGPIRKLRYEVLDNCPIFDYEEGPVRALFGAAGFARITVYRAGTAGFLLRADRDH